MNSKRKTTIKFPSHRAITTTIAGFIIGFAGLVVFQDPPSSTLIKDHSEREHESTVLILEKLDMIEEQLLNLKSEVSAIKNRVESENNKE